MRFNLAMSLQELDRHDESLRILAECKRIFLDHGDRRNANLCTFSEGVLLQRLRRAREAREIYLLLLVANPDLDVETRAATHLAIGFCSIDLGAFDDAETNLSRAQTLFTEIGQPLSALKAEAGRGRLLIRSRRAHLGIDVFKTVRRSFLAQGMHEEAGLSGIEIVEGLLIVGRASHAEMLARQLVGELTAAGLNNRAITALGYLTEAIASRKAKPSHAVEVREYILSLRTNPERDFKPQQRLTE